MTYKLYKIYKARYRYLVNQFGRGGDDGDMKFEENLHNQPSSEHNTPKTKNFKKTFHVLVIGGAISSEGSYKTVLRVLSDNTEDYDENNLYVIDILDEYESDPKINNKKYLDVDTSEPLFDMTGLDEQVKAFYLEEMKNKPPKQSVRGTLRYDTQHPINIDKDFITKELPNKRYDYIIFDAGVLNKLYKLSLQQVKKLVDGLKFGGKFIIGANQMTGLGSSIYYNCKEGPEKFKKYVDELDDKIKNIKDDEFLFNSTNVIDCEFTCDNNHEDIRNTLIDKCNDIEVHKTLIDKFNNKEYEEVCKIMIDKCKNIDKNMCNALIDKCKKIDKDHEDMRKVLIDKCKIDKENFSNEGIIKHAINKLKTNDKCRASEVVIGRNGNVVLVIKRIVD